MRTFLKDSRHFRGATELKHVLFSLALIAVSLVAGMWLRGGNSGDAGTSSANNVGASNTSNTHPTVPAVPDAKTPFTLTPPSKDSNPKPKPPVEAKPVVMTPEIQKFAESYRLFKTAFATATPDLPVAKAALKDMSQLFSDPVNGISALGTFAQLVKSLPSSAMPTIASVLELPLSTDARNFLLNTFLLMSNEALNQAIRSWLESTIDFAALEASFPVLSDTQNKTAFLNAAKSLLKDNRGDLKIPPAVRWQAADFIFESGGPDALTELTTLASKDSDEKIRTQASILLKALAPTEDAIVVLGSKKWSNEKNPSTGPLQSGDIIRSLDNTEYAFPGQIETALNKKAPTDTVLLIFKRDGVEYSRKCPVSELLNQVTNVKLHAARVSSSLAPKKDKDNF